MTSFWKAQLSRLAPEIPRLFEEPDFIARYDAAVAAIREAPAEGEDVSLEELSAYALSAAHTAELLAIAKARSPILLGCFGEAGLGLLVKALIIAGVVRQELGEGAAYRVLARLAPRSLRRLPGNPIGVLTPDAELLNVPAGATARDLLGVAEYRRALQPAGKRGRPPGTKDPAPRKTKRALDPEVAALVLAARRAGVPAYRIAERLWPGEPYGSKLRGRVGRLCEKAELDESRAR